MTSTAAAVTRPRILVADDFRPFRGLMRGMFRQWFGCAPLEAADACEVSHVLEHEDVDLIILDLGLPKIDDGVALLKTLKRNAATRKTPVLVVSGVVEAAGEDRNVLNMGASAFFWKLGLSVDQDSPLVECIKKELAAKARLPSKADLEDRLSVLVIDDEDNYPELIRTLLASDSVDVIHAPTGREGLRLASLRTPDLVILDLNLPGMKGEEVCRRLRAGPYVPVLMLTGDPSADRQVRGFDKYQADDYVLKTGPLPVLAVRIRRLLRGERFRLDGDAKLKIGSMQLDADARVIRVRSTEISLTRIEAALLTLLMSARGKAITARKLFRLTHRRWPAANSGSIKECMSNIREKLGDDCSLIESTYGAGYRFNIEYAHAMVCQGPKDS